MIELTVSEPTAIELEVVEAKIKPEQTKTVTPTYEAQTVLPDAGTTLGQVNVEAIPEPTEVKDISENGDHDVRRYGTARVHVQPRLQSKTVTPTETQQAITADDGYDGLDKVEIGRIPTEYIIPAGTKNISQNGTESVKEYDSVNVSVEPTLQAKTVVPTKKMQTVNADSGYDGLDTVEVEPIPSEYIVPSGSLSITENGQYNVTEKARVDVDVGMEYGVILSGVGSNGAPTKLTTYGYTRIPEWFFMNCGAKNYSRAYVYNYIDEIHLNEGITLIGDYAFRETKSLSKIEMPSTLRQLGGMYAFLNSTAMLIDFSKCTEVVVLTSTLGIGIKSGCVIRVPQALLTEWQAATNWCDLTDVVWEGV